MTYPCMHSMLTGKILGSEITNKRFRTVHLNLDSFKQSKMTNKSLQPLV